MTARIGTSAPTRQARSRRELAALTVAGAAAAGLVLLASRQDLARVIVRAPRPLPTTTTMLTAADLRPAIAALAVAALASLTAVLATRGIARRFTGLVAAALGAGIVALAAGQVTVAQALAAAGHASAAPATGGGAGIAPGSVTAGGAAGQGGAAVSGFPAQVLIEGAYWRWLMTAGALVLVAIGLLVVVRASRLPAMSARYSRSGPASSGLASSAPASAAKAGSVRDASLWDSLSAGIDPTDWPAGDDNG
ncbi:MAG TPA: Trp biosynthesis-associated membrane protein [Streptosporangiaceae bacterium]|nr:Trp biosynthesis-associated membrane protein [Streptosporangiaceae bacterium]